MSAWARVLCLCITVCSSLPGQVVSIPDNSPASGSPSTIPFSQSGAYSCFLIYTAAQLTAGGVIAGRFLNEIAFAPAGAAVPNTFQSPQARILIGHVVPTPSPSGWTSNFLNWLAIHDLNSGPFVMPWIGNTWSPLPCQSLPGFQWNGVNDIGIFMTFASGSTGTFSGRISPLNTRYGLPVFNASNQVPTASGLGAPKARLTFGGTPPVAPWMTNQLRASLDLDGVAGSPCFARTASVCVGAPTTINTASSTPGAGWELIYSVPSTLVPVGSGALFFPNSGQSLNLLLGSPNTGFLGNLTFPPYPVGNLSIQVTPPGTVSASAQMLILTNTNADGFALSAPVQITATTSPVIPGPTANNGFTTLNFGAGLLCSLPTLTFYGTSYTECFVSSNGRVTFVSGSTDGTPFTATALSGQPFIGAWSDLDPSAGGSVIASLTTPTTLRIDYVGVPYFGSTVLATFGIEFDTSLSTCRIDGIGGIGSLITTTQFLGISGGSAIGSINFGTTAFSPAGFGFAASVNSMTYAFGSAGTLAPGITSITFVPNGFGNYDWVSL